MEIYFGDDVIILRARHDMIKTRQLQLEFLLYVKLVRISSNIWFPLWNFDPNKVKTFLQSIVDEQIAEIWEALRLRLPTSDGELRSAKFQLLFRSTEKNMG